MRNRILAASTVAMLGLGSFPLTALAADTTTTSKSTDASTATKVTPTGHKPGDIGYGVDLPKDLTYTTIDGEQVMHPCAGRKMAYQSHNDALYATRDARVDGNPLSVMAVDGQQVTPMDQLCFRLAPDADNKGNEVSRLVIGDGLEFMGDKGDTVWFAPQQTDFSKQWRPLWSGLGAFDRAHELEGNVPKGSTAYFDMVDISAPEGGAVHIFRSHFEDIDRYFSSDNKDMRTVKYDAGAHGHFNWVFTEPGIYKITWKVRLKSPDSKVEESKPVDQYWLVGDDKTVGLKEGTTKNLNEITTPVEDQSGATTAPTTTTPSGDSGDSGELFPGLKPAPGPQFDPNAPAKPSETPTTAPAKPSETPTTAPAVPSETPTTAPAVPSEPVKPGDATASETQQPSDPAVVPPAPGTPEVCTPVDALATKPTAFIKSGHMDLALQGPKGEINARLHDDSDVGNPVERESGTFLFEVADSAKTAIPEQYKDTFLGKSEDWWILPQGQVDGLPWLGFSTTGLNAESLAPDSTVTVTMKDVVGPGQLVTWHQNLNRLQKELDSADPNSSLQYGMTDHDHQNFGFSKPGLYAATFVYSGTDGNGEEFTEELRASFAVGTEAIKEATAQRDNGYASVDGEGCAATDGSPAGTGGTQSQWDRLISAVENIGKGVDHIGTLLEGGTNTTAPGVVNADVDNAPATTGGDSAAEPGSAAEQGNPLWEAFFKINGTAMGLNKEAGPLAWYLQLRMWQNAAGAVQAVPAIQEPEPADTDVAQVGGVDDGASVTGAGESQNAGNNPVVAPVEDGAVADGASAGQAPAAGGAAPAESGGAAAPAAGTTAGATGQAATGKTATGGTSAVSQASGQEGASGSGVSEAENVEQAPAEENDVPDAESASTDASSAGVVSSIQGQSPASNRQDLASQGMANGGFWAGLSFGVGAMALVGGAVLFSAAWRALRDIRGNNPDLTATQIIK